MTEPSTTGCGFLSLEELDSSAAGTLAAERRDAFERHVDGGCPACILLAADLRTFREVVSDGASGTERREFERGAELLGARLTRQARGRETARHRPGGSRTLAAAAAVLLAVVAWALLDLGGPSAPGSVLQLPDGGELEIEAMPFSRPPTIRGEVTARDAWERGGVAYERGRFAEAAALLSEIGGEDPHAADAALYRGISLLMAGQSDEARRALETSLRIAGREQLPTESIRWFEGLAALADGDEPAALQALAAVADGPGPYAGEARLLLDRLSSP